LIGGVIAVMGIGIVALPTAIIATGFAEEVQKRRKARHETKHGAKESQPERHAGGARAGGATCPHCGKPIELSTPDDSKDGPAPLAPEPSTTR